MALFPPTIWVAKVSHRLGDVAGVEAKTTLTKSSCNMLYVPPDAGTCDAVMRSLPRVTLPP